MSETRGVSKTYVQQGFDYKITFLNLQFKHKFKMFFLNNEAITYSIIYVHSYLKNDPYKTYP